MHLEAKVIAVFFVVCASMSPVRADSPMQTYEVQLPSRVLRVALPNEIARGKLPVKYTDTLDFQNPSFVRDGFYDVLEAMGDFDGPFFWSEPYGSLKINVVVVQKKSAVISADIMTLDGLELYIREWKKISPGAGGPPPAYSHVTINGMPAILRSLDTFLISGSDQPHDSQIYSIPLTPEMFLNVNLTIIAWKEDRAKEPKWRPQAKAMRDSIKASLALIPKPTR
jgi:hypothetical protein